MVSDKNELVLLLMGFKVGGTRRRIEGAKKTSENKLFLSKSKVARQCLLFSVPVPATYLGLKILVTTAV